MSAHIDIEQGEDPGIPPSVLSGRDNAAGVPVVGPAAAPGADTVTLTRPLCIDGEFYPTETETLTVRRDQVIGL